MPFASWKSKPIGGRVALPCVPTGKPSRRLGAERSDSDGLFQVRIGFESRAFFVLLCLACGVRDSPLLKADVRTNTPITSCQIFRGRLVSTDAHFKEVEAGIRA